MSIHFTLTAFRMRRDGYSVGKPGPALVIVRGARVTQIGLFYAFTYTINVGFEG
jgi:hypothetical protein